MNKYNSPHHQTPNRLGLSRRDFMAVGGLGVAGYALTKRFEPFDVLAQSNIVPMDTADACIFFKLTGAPSHMDTFGYKEGYWTPDDWRKSAETRNNVTLPGNIFPGLLSVSDKIAIVNSVQAYVPVHQVGQYWLDTAHDFNAALAGERPAVGAVVAMEYQSRRRPGDVLPGFFALAGNLQIGNGFLNGLAAPFPIAGNGNATARLIPVTGVPSMTHPRGDDGYAELQDMIGAIDGVNRGENPPWGKPISDYNDFYEGARAMYTDPDVAQAFQYTDAERAAYGNRTFGDACLVARNLLTAEKGVKFIQIALGSWDHHANVYPSLRTLAPIFDNGLTALIKDLSKRPSRTRPGKTLLDTTLIVAMGEFGRTPSNRYTNPNGLSARNGRDHYANVQSALFVGGGVQGGKMFGVTDEFGAVITDPQWRWASRPPTVGGPNIRMEDIGTTIYSALNINWTRVIADTPSRRRYEYIAGGPDTYYREIKELFE